MPDKYLSWASHDNTRNSFVVTLGRAMRVVILKGVNGRLHQNRTEQLLFQTCTYYIVYNTGIYIK